MGSTNSKPETADRSWDHGSRDEFVEYYERQSVSPEAVARGERARDAILRFREKQGLANDRLRILDIGCNAGTFSFPWAGRAHEVVGVDINERLIEVARSRAAESNLDVDFRVGSATELPVEDDSFDVCISPELLEHVEDWVTCLDEYARVLKRNGVLFLTTTNSLCPKQQEFDLPLYSWYPGFLKRHFVRLSTSTRPELANYATYPAVNWFTFYGLRRELRRRSLESFDRFDVIDLENASTIKRVVVRLIRSAGPFRFLAQVCTPSTIVMAWKGR